MPLSNRQWTKAIAIAALAAITGCGQEPADPPQQSVVPEGNRRNVVIITLDTLRKDHIGCYGSDVRTENIDRLAENGTLFETAYSAAPTTLPSHTTLMSGHYPAFHGVRLNGRNRVPERVETLAERLKKAGYETGAIVAVSVLDSHFGLDQGFETYDDDMSSDSSSVQKQRIAQKITDSALAWLEEVEEPYFLWVHYFDPHGPYEPPPPYDGMYYQGDPRSPEHSSMQGVPSVFYQKLEGITDIQYPMAQYKAEITYTDAQVGRLIDAVIEDDQARETLLVLTADHGENLGEAKTYFDHGMNLHDVSMTVPLILRGAEIEAGTRSDATVSLVDVVPTVLDYLDLDPNPALPGTSLLPLDQAPSNDRSVFFETFLPTLGKRPPLFGVQKGPWKIIASGRNVALFDTSQDAAEVKNLGAEKQDVLKDILKDLEGYLQTETLKTEELEPTPEMMKILRALGYAK